MTVREFLRRVDSRELAEWEAYQRIQHEAIKNAQHEAESVSRLQAAKAKQ